MVNRIYIFVLTIFSQYYCITGTTWMEIANHPAWLKLNSLDCGDSAADRIIGGKNAALGQFPWIALLGFVDDTEVDWMCGGALITDRHVVTAAHCVVPADPGDGYQLTYVRLGEHDLRSNPDCQMHKCAPPVQDRKVKTIRSHPNFNNPVFHNDIAIIEVEPPYDINDYVAPVCLPFRDEELADIPVGELVTAAGWGTMNMTTVERANILQVIALPVVPREMCNNLGKAYQVGPSEICAGAEHNKDACGGDSGGPLTKVFDTPDGPKNFLVGAVSFGPTICGIKKPGVYSSISYFMKWILDSII